MRSYYDAETGLYYIRSRYYDPDVCRFISADDVNILTASPMTLTDKNLYTYCDNNPIMRRDIEGEFWSECAGIIVASGIVGGLMGAFSAAATGGNVFEGAIEGAINGAIGAVCGLRGLSSVWAGVAAAAVDAITQSVSYYNENKSMKGFEWNVERSLKTGALTVISTAIPKFGQGAKNSIDAFGTGLIWAEGTTLITCADVIGTNVKSSVVSRQKSVPGKSRVNVNRRMFIKRRRYYSKINHKTEKKALLV